ncbi:hypothetical protein F442_09658 [Phytophthora nicotianae P10297]|uniref:Retrovirus-related Pol polyprotein from transposon TNT 1-94-like beta-barrel domain-containing protein n=1 Tax=Phytophthora nicotianae P10297 TaxID=1317064 RepID=W2Z8Q0_PHYNI|nr:hypothetical protein F442_09658 [Phytophthora nicotianae P10297]
MSPSYANTIDKFVEDNYFHWEFNMRMKLARKGLLAQIIKPKFDQVSDRSTVEWKTNDLKVLGAIAGDVSLTYQVYIRGALTAAEAWTLLEEHFNKKTLKNLFFVIKKLHSFKMEPGTKFAVDVDKFKKLVLQMESIGEPLDEIRQLVLLLGSLTTTKGLRKDASLQWGVLLLQESRAQGVRDHVTQAQASNFAFTAASAMPKSEWLVDSGASSHMTSVRDKFVSIKDLKTLIRITIADSTKIDAVATGTVGLKLMD